MRFVDSSSFQLNEWIHIFSITFHFQEIIYSNWSATLLSSSVVQAAISAYPTITSNSLDLSKWKSNFQITIYGLFFHLLERVTKKTNAIFQPSSVFKIPEEIFSPKKIHKFQSSWRGHGIKHIFTSDISWVDTINVE